MLDAARQAGVAVSAVCNGQGTCHACKFKFTESTKFESQIEEPTISSLFRRENEWLLSCQTRLIDDCGVFFPSDSLATSQRLQLEMSTHHQITKSDFFLLDYSLADDELHDILLEKKTISDSLFQLSGKSLQIPFEFEETMKKQLREHKPITLVCRNEQVFSIRESAQPILGLAVDVGTTKIAGYLVDLISGETLTSGGVINPQVAYGEDVVSRIAFSNTTLDGLKILHDRLMESINSLTRDICKKANLDHKQIIEAVLVGNTLMQHFVREYPVKQLGEAPYKPYSCDPYWIAASKIGLTISPNGMAYLPPNVAGFVGGDHIAMLLASLPENKSGTILALDIGTNTEISLLTTGKHLACSCASGPAFEGSRIKDGMRALPGAIERVFVSGDTIQVQTVDDQPALGICGSGILDAVAEFYRTGRIDSRGRIVKKRGVDKITKINLVEPDRSGTGREISIYQNDINEIQLAKAAIRSGIDTLLRKQGIPYTQIDQIIIAGAFGTYIDVENAIRIGMLPPIDPKKIAQLGNAAGGGAKQLLLSARKRDQGLTMSSRIEYLELMLCPDYMDLFVDSINFPIE